MLVDHRCALGILLLGAAPAVLSQPVPPDIASLSFEELANIEITSVSKKAEKLSSAAASIYVIRAEDIRRAGVGTLTEALRLAPNLDVAQIDARNYAISARGFNTSLVNKLEVLIDGRNVYTPLYSGVFWDAQDVVLDDIERIEVISGPGATLWGANAVNGVINIITKSAADTQGGSLAGGGGTEFRNGVARYGGKMDNGAAYRVYAKVGDSDNGVRADGHSTAGSWRHTQAGFRSDFSAFGGDATLQGDTYQASSTQLAAADIAISGANLLGRLTRQLAPGEAVSAQLYVDYTKRDQPPSFREAITTVDAEVQRTIHAGAAHELVVGGGYRIAFDRVDNGPAFSFLPGAKDLHWANLFAQDEIALAPDWRLTAGLKLETNSYTGREWLPDLRLAWQVAPNRLLWGALSRAVRVPSRIDRDWYVPTSPPVVNGMPSYLLAGGPDFVSETADVVQLGYRSQPLRKLSWSLTLYASAYDHLRSIETGPGGTGFVFGNFAEGRSRGAEWSANWEVHPHWRLAAGLVAQHLSLGSRERAHDPSGTSGLGVDDPPWYGQLRSTLDLSDTMELDMSLRHHAALPKPEVPAYSALDLRWGWKIRKNLDLSVLVQNLIGAGHAEFGAPATRSVFERSLFARLTWRF
jgi:iron complex outermembrane recepter protein